MIQKQSQSSKSLNIGLNQQEVVEPIHEEDTARHQDKYVKIEDRGAEETNLDPRSMRTSNKSNATPSFNHRSRLESANDVEVEIQIQKANADFDPIAEFEKEKFQESQSYNHFKKSPNDVHLNEDYENG